MRVLAAVLLLAACSQGSFGDDDPDARTGDDDNEFGPDAAEGPDIDPPTSAAQPPGGAYFNVPRVLIGADETATIYYTVDGSAPTTSSPSGPAPLTVEGLTADTPLRYFAVDAAGNAESPHDDLYAIDRDATLTISLANETVTVTDPPGGLDLTGTASYDGGTDILSVTLSVTNLEPRLLFHLKAMFDAPNQGTITADGTLAGTRFAYFGPEVLDAGASKTADTFTITGVNGAIDPITVDVTFRTDPTWVFNGSWDNGPVLVDSSNSGMTGDGYTEPFGYRGLGGDSHVRSAVLAPDGRYVYLGMRNVPHILVKDLTTLQTTVGVELDDGVGAVTWLEMSPDGGAIFALLLTGDHTRQRSNNAAGCRGPIAESTTCEHSAPDLTLVKLRRSDLTELARVPLVTDASDRHTRAGLFALSPDGTRAAVPINGTGRVVFVDLQGSMQVLQDVDVTSRFFDAHSAAYSADGERLFVVERSGTDAMLAIDTATYALSDEAPPTAVNHTTSGSLRRGPDGRIYFLRGGAGNELAIYDPADDSWEEVELGLAEPASIAFPAASSYAISERDAFEVRSATDNVRLTLNSDHSDVFGVGTHGHVFLIGPE
jgi:hypothetical protein